MPILKMREIEMLIDKKNCLEYGIVTDGTPSAEYAKQELQNFIQQSCGFCLKDYNGQPHYISLGENAYSQNIVAEYDLSDLNEEGFYILPKDGNVYVFGASPKSVIFGAYEFLEEYLWYYNNERISLKLKGMSPVQYRTHSQI